MNQQLENMKQSIINLATMIEDAQKEAELWKAVVKERDKQIQELKDHLNQRDIENESLRVDLFNCEEALDEQMEVSDVLRQSKQNLENTIEGLYQERDALKKLVKSYKEFLAYRAKTESGKLYGKSVYDKDQKN